MPSLSKKQKHQKVMSPLGKATVRRGERKRKCMKKFYKEIVKKPEANRLSNLSNAKGRVTMLGVNKLIIRSFITECKWQIKFAEATCDKYLINIGLDGILQQVGINLGVHYKTFRELINILTLEEM